MVNCASEFNILQPTFKLHRIHGHHRDAQWNLTWCRGAGVKMWPSKPPSWWLWIDQFSNPISSFSSLPKFHHVSPCFTMFHRFLVAPKLDPCFPDVSYVVPCVEGRLHMQTDPTARFVGAAPPTGGCVAIKAQIRFVVAWRKLWAKKLSSTPNKTI